MWRFRKESRPKGPRTTRWSRVTARRGFRRRRACWWRFIAVLGWRWRQRCWCGSRLLPSAPAAAQLAFLVRSVSVVVVVFIGADATGGRRRRCRVIAVVTAIATILVLVLVVSRSVIAFAFALFSLTPAAQSCLLLVRFGCQCFSVLERVFRDRECTNDQPCSVVK